MKCRCLLLWILLLPFPRAGAIEGRDTSLPPADAGRLQFDKVLVTNRHWQQVFTPYIFSPMPVFLTTDSLMNAWHVLFEESLAVMEEANARELPGALTKSLADLVPETPESGKDEAEFRAAVRRARIVLGTAARLAGGKWTGEPDVEAAIGEQVRLVEQASALALPAWLPPDPELAALDYRVFRPVGLYTRNAGLERYFRAIRWLQTIPFRVGNPEEVAAMERIAGVLEASCTVLRIAGDYESFGGGAANVDARAVQKAYGLREALEEWQEAHGSGPVRMTVLAAISLPDASVFENSTGPARPYPDGQEIAAWLGSTLARENLASSPGAPPEIPLRVTGSLFWQESVYEGYLDALSSLFAPPEPGAPAFMNSPEWRCKTLNTALGGWAQLRHAWALQAKLDQRWLPSGRPYPGFVEPVPEFYRRMSRVIMNCIARFEAAESLTLSPASVAAYAAGLLPELEPLVARIVSETALIEAGIPDGDHVTEEQRERLANVSRFSEAWIERLQPFRELLTCTSYSFPPFRISGVNDPVALLTEIRGIAAGERAANIRAIEASGMRTSLRTRWMNLLSACHTMETLAHKQLRGVEPTKDERGFIVAYGAILGGIMLYDGNSYLSPRDDAPRIAAVYLRPGEDFLLAGVGRPQEIRVLYPWKGEEIECRGAILPYREFRSPRALTDAEWQKRDAEGGPPPPDWLRPVLSPPPVPVPAPGEKEQEEEERAKDE